MGKVEAVSKGPRTLNKQTRAASQVRRGNVFVMSIKCHIYNLELCKEPKLLPISIQLINYRAFQGERFKILSFHIADKLCADSGSPIPKSCKHLA